MMSIIYVVRHGQSQGNADPSIYGTMPNQEIPLSEKGVLEAIDAGVKLRTQVDEDKKRSYDLCTSRTVSTAQQVYAFALFSSPYKRTVQTAEIIGKQIGIQKISQNILLSERQYGEQEGCNDVDDFSPRPMERDAYRKAGHLWYRPHRGESLIDLYMRVTLFFLQQGRFEYIPISIISSHLSTCQMFHALFTNEMPTSEMKWKNGEARKYEVSSMLKYLGTV